MAVLTMPKVKVLAEYDNGKGLTAFKALSRANRRKLTILSNAFHDRLLTGGGDWESFKAAYPAWTGTKVSYERPNKGFKDYVAYKESDTGITYRFKVPSDYRGAKNALLLVEHGFDENGNPKFEIHQDGKDRVIHVPNESNIVFVQNFPAKDGWYLTDEHGIPVGKEVSSENQAARYLARTKNYAGLVARDYDDYDDGGRYVNVVSGRFVLRFGVLVEGVQNLKIFVPDAEKVLNQLGGVVDATLLKPLCDFVAAVKD